MQITGTDARSVPSANTPSKKYEQLEKLRVLPRDLDMGVQRLREEDAARIYLPRNPTESIETVPGFGTVDPWWNRVNSSRLKNMFKDAVEDCVGRAFAKEAKPDAEMPDDLVGFMDDVDGRGTNFHVFGMNVASASCTEGEDFVLVDYPTTDPSAESMTQAEWEMLKRAPFWRRYPAKSVIGWHHDKFGKVERLMRVRLRESMPVADGPWGVRMQDQVRVLYAGDPLAELSNPKRWARWEVWQAVEPDKPEGEWRVTSFGDMKPQVDIPFVNFPFLLSAPFEGRPPFLDLAHLTIAHYRKLSALDNAQHAVGFPILHWAGGPVDPATKRPVVGVASNRLFVSGDPAAHVEFVEPAGTAWASVRTELDSMEAAARELASEPVSTQASGNLTATGEAIRAARASSRLEAAVLGWQDSFNRLFYYTAQYMELVEYGAESGWGGVELNRRFVPITRNIEGFGKALEMHGRGRLSDETLFDIAQEAEVVPEAISFDEEEKRIEQSGPSLQEQDRVDAATQAEEMAAAIASGKAGATAPTTVTGKVLEPGTTGAAQ